MPNMSYCRFQNTYQDLRDCYEALMETPIEDLSLTEQKYAKYLIELCKTITEEYAEVEDDE